MYVNPLLYEYEPFRPVVSDIRTGAMKVRYLGGGSESEVFEAKLDEKLYAVKFAVGFTPYGRSRNTFAATQRKINAGLRGLGIGGLEQIVTASPEEGVAIFEYVQGVRSGLMTEEDLGRVTEMQIQNLYKTIDQAVDAGIEFDPWNQDGSNVLYSPETGFTLIDYFVEYANISPDESRINGFKALGDTAIKLTELFGNR